METAKIRILVVGFGNVARGVLASVNNNPDMELAGKDGMDKAAVLKKMEENIAAVNVDMPNYSKIAGVRLVPEEFEKTPKKSIKRYMYQQNS